MKKVFLFIITIVIVAIVFLSLNKEKPEKELSSINNTLDFNIVKKVVDKKGSKNSTSHYKLLRAYVVLQKDQKNTKESVKIILDDILSKLILTNNSDAIAVWLYPFGSNIEDALYFSSVEWWPKGHNLSKSNEKNIMNKETYETRYYIDLPVSEVDIDSKVARLSLEEKKEIFKGITAYEKKASRLAEKKYPWDGSKIPYDKLKNYDFKTAFENFEIEEKKLVEKFKEQFLQDKKLTVEELKNISYEGLLSSWPLY